MPNVIVRPDLPVQMYTVRWRLRVPRVCTARQRELAMREQGEVFLDRMRQDGFDWHSSYGMKIVKGPIPVVEPKGIPKLAPDDTDLSFLVEQIPVDVADEVEFELVAWFTRPAILTEMLESDMARMGLKGLYEKQH